MRTANICYVARALESNFCHEVISVAAARQIQRSNWSCLAFLVPFFGNEKRDKEISVEVQNDAICKEKPSAPISEKSFAKFLRNLRFEKR